MGALLIVILLVLLYGADKKIKELQKENKNLKKEISKFKNENIVDKMLINRNEEKISNQESFNNILQNSFKKDIKKTKEKKENKNIIILITGAILIVLAAIVFLMSTWYSIPNVLKIVVLMLLVGVFLYGSKIAKEKFSLQKTSLTFFYMAMAYIPICLLSISVLGLFGEYLSITGNGKFIYLMLSAFLTSVIYYIIYKKYKDNKLFIGSILSQIFSVIMFTLIFSEKIELISLSLLLYNIILNILFFEKKDKFITTICTIIPYISIILIFYAVQSITYIIPLNLIILALNFLILEMKQKNNINSHMFNISIGLSGIYFIWIMNSNVVNTLKTLYTLIYFISLYIIQNIINVESFKKASSMVIFVVLNVLLLKNCIPNTECFKPYLISMIQVIILLWEYIKSKEIEKDITSYLIPVYFILSGILIFLEYEVSYHYYIIFSIITFIIFEVLKGKKIKTLRENAFIVSNIFINLIYLIAYLTNRIEMKNDVLYFIILTIIQFYNYFRTKKAIFKYLFYTTIYIIIASIFVFFELPKETFKIIPTVILIILLNCEIKYKELEDEYSFIFFQIIKILAYIFLISMQNEVGTIISISLGIYLMYCQNKNNEKVHTNLIPILGCMPSIFSYSLNKEFQIFIMIFSILGLIYISLRKQKNNIYIILSGMYMLLAIERINIDYLNEIIFIVWSLIYWYFIEEEKKKDLFKFLSFIGGLVLYNTCIEEVNLDNYTFFVMLGYIVVLMITIRDIAIKYLDKKNLDIVEGIAFASVYYYALTEYSSEYDGMLFVLLIVAILIFSYLKKYGSMFLVSVAGILLNVFLLTREFWFNVPWWIYLLILGSILISFAIKNEANEKSEKFKISESIKKIKEKIEK